MGIYHLFLLLLFMKIHIDFMLLYHQMQKMTYQS